ncbi:hypothetical protein [Megasphaera cerevisiae]|uniref:hypothetical protein n=1 Tax=Megasphaera cerevisiae TaxID=39029 RepID=UPI000ACAEF56|nr:hypothetical protein [Megasphaera cerevisiae]
MEKKFKIGFHHIGKPVPLEKIQNNAAVKYSPLFDMYSLDMDSVKQCSQKPSTSEWD